MAKHLFSRIAVTRRPLPPEPVLNVVRLVSAAAASPVKELEPVNLEWMGPTM
jgi:hypothetical protein